MRFMQTVESVGVVEAMARHQLTSACPLKGRVSDEAHLGSQAMLTSSYHMFINIVTFIFTGLVRSAASIMSR
jgi:hypothetical protein